MILRRASPGRLALLIAVMPASAASEPVKPWVLENDCSWWLSGPDGKELHASIGQGDDDPVLTIADRAFLPFTEEERIPVVLRFDGDPKREAPETAWVSSIVGDGERMLGTFLSAEARQAMGGAIRMEVVHQDKVLTELPLAATPSQAELDACVVPPGPKGDSE